MTDEERFIEWLAESNPKKPRHNIKLIWDFLKLKFPDLRVPTVWQTDEHDFDLSMTWSYHDNNWVLEIEAYPDHYEWICWERGTNNFGQNDHNLDGIDEWLKHFPKKE